MGFPSNRPRRLRSSPELRNLVSETKVGVDDLIYPLFIVPGHGVKKEISSIPGQYQFSIDMLLEEMKSIEDLGINSILLFGIPEWKDASGSSSFTSDGIIQKALDAIKNTNSNLFTIADLCLCEYTDHGHCGHIVKDGEKFDVDNDETLKLLAKQAISLANSGVDMIAPSGNMDGMVKSLRTALDENSFKGLPIMSYSVKYNSSFYGPFRAAVESAPSFGDRSTYQMNPANKREALREVKEDLDEGADIVMVKPALSYLDVIQSVKEASNVPVAAYNVSGEYSILKHAAKVGLIDEEKAINEVLTSIKRAGADIIITYFAKYYAEKLKR